MLLVDLLAALNFATVFLNKKRLENKKDVNKRKKVTKIKKLKKRFYVYAENDTALDIHIPFIRHALPNLMPTEHRAV